jgi:hypothetical protein
MGKQLIAFQPAGKMEAFFGELSKIEGVPRPEVMQSLFSRPAEAGGVAAQP